MNHWMLTLGGSLTCVCALLAYWHFRDVRVLYSVRVELGKERADRRALERAAMAFPEPPAEFGDGALERLVWWKNQLRRRDEKYVAVRNSQLKMHDLLSQLRFGGAILHVGHHNRPQDEACRDWFEQMQRVLSDVS